MKRIPTTLVSKATGEPVAAVLLSGVTRSLIDEVELAWASLRIEGAKRIKAAGGRIPEHWHWSWQRKAGYVDLLAYHCFGVECDSEIQGLMLVNTTNAVSRATGHRGKPLVYVDYVEVAPWNAKALTESPRFGGVGARLIEAAVRYSIEEGFAGRVGLHSLPQSEDFYGRTCRMTRGEIDMKYEGLRWFEFTGLGAKEFLGD